MNKKIVAVLTLVCAIPLFLPLFNVDTEYTTGTFTEFTSYQELKQLIQTAHDSISYYWGYSGGLFSPKAATSSMAKEWDYSRTNVQVAGVDEADVVKTDGEYIFAVSNRSVFIARAYPPEAARVLSSITVNGTLKGIFVNDDRLAILYENFSENFSWHSYSSDTFIAIYDVTDRASPTAAGEVSTDGSYLNSRMIGDWVYLIVSKSAYLVGDDVDLPKMTVYGTTRTIEATEISHSDIPDYGYAFTTVLAVNVKEDGAEPTRRTMLLGTSATMYVSQTNIYLTTAHYDKTSINRIHIENGEIQPKADGEILGYATNQFSMDEFDGHFRIATTSALTSPPIGETPRLGTQNNLYVLDSNLEVVGKIEGLAPGEQIHSVRFMGNRGYVVTFRKIDPFFVVDLSDPYEPRVLGQLKITGYSDYLHPYDENHIIGVGKETIAAEEGDFSWYQGVKISLFDVSDVSNPKELAKIEIGDRGSDTPVLSDHKAFLFDREKELLVLPVSIAEVNPNDSRYSGEPSAYGQTVWQGACVFTIRLEPEPEITLRGKVTHVENGQVYDTSQHVTRTLYINDTLYTISSNKIKLSSLQNLGEVGELILLG